MLRILVFTITLSLTLACCKSSTETSEQLKGQISGKVYNSLTNQTISRQASLTLAKLNTQSSTYDSLRSTSSDSTGRYSFFGLAYGGYYVSTNTDNYFKTGYVMFVTISADAPNQVLDVPIDTVRTRS